MYRYELNHKGGWKTNAFELWCWRRPLRGPWTARRSNQSVLKETSIKYSWEGLMLKLKLQYFCHLMERADSLGRETNGKRKRGWQRMKWLNNITDSMDVNLSILWEIVEATSLVAQRLKHLPGMRETRVRSLGREDPLEKEMANHSSTLPWKIPWREEPGRLQSVGSQRVGHDWATSLSLH